MNYKSPDRIETSVCMASYNGEAYIREQLNSILCQLSDCDELIVSDDGSTDRTLSIVKEFSDERIRLFRSPDNRGVTENFEFALKQARGDYIFLADQDDIWDKDKIRIMAGYLKEFDLVVSDCMIMDKNGRKLADSYFKIRHSGTGVIKNICQNTYMGCCMAFKKKILDYALPFPKHVPMHDWWIGLVADTFDETLFCSEQLVCYRRHGQNETPIDGQSRLRLKQRFVHRTALACGLFKLWVKKNSVTFVSFRR
ncbi:MAG: glycosyltransferase family 2 protein [Desulfobacterales bacterium]|nr:glycosyltransferase family 2 protein [Desulfobacterales bacterium]